MCATPRLNYLLRTVYPNLLRPYLKQFDTDLMHCFNSLFFADADQERINVVIDELRMPIRLGGVGLRSLFSISKISFLCSSHTLLSYITNIIPEVNFAKHQASKFTKRLASHPFYAAAKDAYHCVKQDLRDTSLPEPIHRVLAPTWIDFLDRCSSSDATALQHHLTAALEKHRFKTSLKNKANLPEEAARVRSLTVNATPNYWLTTLPTDKSLTLSDQDMVAAMGTRYAVRPTKASNSDLQPCKCVLRSHDSTATMYHFFNCSESGQRMTAHNLRHDLCVNAHCIKSWLLCEERSTGAQAHGR
jgi:hypothetical protein